MTVTTPMATPVCTKGSKYNIGEKLYCFNIGMQAPLVREITLEGIIKADEGMLYTGDKNLWIKEEYLFKTKKEAYKHLIEQAEKEMLD